MTEPTYIQIHCENQRRKDMRWRFRSVHAPNVPPGRCFAEKQEGAWRCCCCGKKVSVAW